MRMKSSRFNRPNAKGRNDREPTDRFARMPYRILESSAYRSLTPNARALLIEILMMFNGKNNGSIILSQADALDRIGLSDPVSVKTAFESLLDVGFIRMSKDAHFVMKAGDRRAREWTITWLSIVGQAGPTDDFIQWQPDSSTPAGKKIAKRADKGLRALAKLRKQPLQNQNAQEESFTMTPKQHAKSELPQEESCTVKSKNDAIQPFDLMEDSSIHVDLPDPSGEAQSCRPVSGGTHMPAEYRIRGNLLFASWLNDVAASLAENNSEASQSHQIINHQSLQKKGWAFRGRQFSITQTKFDKLSKSFSEIPDLQIALGWVDDMLLSMTLKQRKLPENNVRRLLMRYVVKLKHERIEREVAKRNAQTYAQYAQMEQAA
jgi:hypothetical protein